MWMKGDDFKVWARYSESAAHWFLHVTAMSALSSLWRGGFNRSTQHLLILRGEEVCPGDITDLAHGSAEDRTVAAVEERAKCCGHLGWAVKSAIGVRVSQIIFFWFLPMQRPKAGAVRSWHLARFFSRDATIESIAA